MGHYESSGMFWDKGEIPKCSYCGKQAVWETCLSGVIICDNQSCKAELLAEELSEITYVED